MTITTDNFVSELLKQVPELRPAMDKHVSENDEILPHVFFGDVARFALQEAFMRRSDALRRLLNDLELAMTCGNDEVQNVIAVSFLENLGPPGESFDQIRLLLGPCLSRELKNFWKEDAVQ